MNEATRAMCKLLIDHNHDEMALMFRQSDGMEKFTEKVENYIWMVIAEEVDFGAIATEFAELPFREATPSS